MHQHLKCRGLEKKMRKRKRSEKIFEEIIIRKYSNMGKEINNQVQAKQSPITGEIQREALRHILIKLTKN